MACFKLYSTSVRYTQTVSKKVAELLDYMVRNNGLQVKDLHLLGLSMSGQIIGQIGQKMKTGKPARITGFDPALPFFHPTEKDKILDESDGQFVDVIHTNAGFFGTNYSQGHVDFYMNGGTGIQPSCVGTIMPAICSHEISFVYFITSLKRKVALDEIECDSLESYRNGLCTRLTGRKIDIGIHIADNVRGSIFLRVGKDFKPPKTSANCF